MPSQIKALKPPGDKQTEGPDFIILCESCKHLNYIYKSEDNFYEFILGNPDIFTCEKCGYILKLEVYYSEEEEDYPKSTFLKTADDEFRVFDIEVKEE